MGGTCSSQRPNRNNSSNRRSRVPSSSPCDSVNRVDGSSSSGSDAASRNRRYSRHSVVTAIPDESIVKLYPLTDNFVLHEETGLRSPKSLSELCTDTLCRSLPWLQRDDSLPPGLPQDVVDDVVASLLKHSALNATTLRVLKNCELASLSLAGCRGVTDDWLEALNTGSTIKNDMVMVSSAAYKDGIEDAVMETAMDIYEEHTDFEYSQVYHNALLEEPSGSRVEESSCSTSSFVSASSTCHSSSGMGGELLCSSSREDHPMPEEIVESTRSSDSKDDTVHGDSYMSFGGDYGVSEPPTLSYSRRRSSSVTSQMFSLDVRGSQQLTDKGLMQLSDLSNLEVAKFDGCFSIQGRGLMALAMSTRMHSLSLANCRRLMDEAVIHISHLISLETLSLDGCRCLTDRSMVAIASLIHLKKLGLSQCDLITDEGLHNLRHLEEIEELSLGWCRSISDAGVRALCSQPGRTEHLRMLSLARIGISDDGVGYLAKLKALEELDLNGCTNIGSSSLGNVLCHLPKLSGLDVSYCPGILRSSWQGKVDSLKRLELCYSGVRDSHLSRLTDMPLLEEINLDSCPISDWSIGHLADNSVVPNLISLDLADTDLSDLGMVHIAKFKKLKKLSLFYCNLTNSSLRHLSKLTELEVLNLDSREISDAGLFHLVGLGKLKSLDIFSGRITDTGCHHIAQIKTLESLELCGGGITDAGCATLATLENLTSLNLSQNDRITNRGAAALAALIKLKVLNLSNTRVNSEAMIHFSDLRNLQSLAIYGCRGMDTPGGSVVLDMLQSGLPNLKCVRLNNVPDDEGVISTSEEDSDEENLESDTETIFFSSGARQVRVPSFRFEDTDSDSEMEDAQNAEDNQSDSSYSDHDH
ncbi:leucine rich repeat LRR-containing protein [Nitzschia inconspicua]|uniref:Leucine rich repeat LRR-containing protein n=1 Tax=Nitzschia inconspicua TaxID=303405 RepID=A0A9K3LEM2_9STRA|nr:leucine rich repeat LRR-containing protein [Nitzschia inconspicua]